jgi:hypothetical protein
MADNGDLLSFVGDLDLDPHNKAFTKLIKTHPSCPASSMDTYFA